MVLDTRRSEYVGINRTGSVLWVALAADAAAGHVDDFAADLEARGMLEPAD